MFATFTPYFRRSCSPESQAPVFSLQCTHTVFCSVHSIPDTVVYTINCKVHLTLYTLVNTAHFSPQLGNDKIFLSICKAQIAKLQIQPESGGLYIRLVVCSVVGTLNISIWSGLEQFGVTCVSSMHSQKCVTLQKLRTELTIYFFLL